MYSVWRGEHSRPLDSLELISVALFHTDLILPFLIFSSLLLSAIKLTFIRLFASGIDLESSCKPTPNFIPTYTGFIGLDEALCPLVDFFSEILRSPECSSYLRYAFGIGIPLLLLPTFEAYRPRQSRILRYPAVWFLLSQIITIGGAISIYWFAFIMVGSAQKYRKSSSKLYTQAEAEALVFGLFVGAVIPSVAMLMWDDNQITALWQFYPIYIAIAESIHLFFRPSSRYPQSGFVTLRVLFFAAFILSSSIHISVIWPRINDWDQLKNLLLPSLTPLSSDIAIAFHYLDFLKWDINIGYTSTTLATLWFAENRKQLFAIVLWYAFAVPILGFGAAVTGVVLWRNDFL